MRNDKDSFEDEDIDEINENEFDDLLEDEPGRSDDGDDGVRKAPERRVNVGKILMISLVAVFIIAAGVLGIIRLDMNSKSYVMVFEGKKISIDDYKLCLLFQDGSAESKDNALSQLTDFLVIEKAAEDYGIVLTDAEKTGVSNSMTGLKESIISGGLEMPAISDERLRAILSVDLYYQKLLEELGKDFVLDEADFKSELENYRQNNRQDYIDVKLKYIMTETREAAEEARGKALSGSAFDDVIKAYSVDYDESAGISTVTLKDISLDQEVVDQILALKVSELTGVIDLGDVFVVFEAAEITVPSDVELEASFKELYIQNRNYDVFDHELEQWRANAVYTVNQKAIDAIDAIDTNME